MPRILLVPDLPLDHSPVMDKYGHRLHDWLESGEPSLEVRLAAHIGELTRELATWLGDDRNVRVVPFGVDRAFFTESPGARERGRADWHIPQDAFVVLHVGSTVDRKNVPLVIDIVARLRNDADTYLLQVGGKFSGEQEQLIDRLRLRGAVRRLRSADEAVLRRGFPPLDLLLFPSVEQGLGLPVLS